MVIKVCIWMNMPSHHQSAFFKALSSQKNIDLVVRYYEKVPNARIRLGWNYEDNLPPNQECIDSIDDIKKSVSDWKERIHIIPGFSSPFLKELIKLAINEKVKWIHWSERSGVGVAKLLHFNYGLMSLLYPVFLHLKGYKKYAKQINEYALGALAIGKLAKDDFIQWGIDTRKIEFLPYSLEGLTRPKESSIQLKKPDEILFMYIGSLYELKGIDILLQAFQKLIDRSDKCKLVLVGEDRSKGKYFEQAKGLGIANRVEFSGVVESTKINEYLVQSDVFILPTRFDGWGAVLNEAASLGKPLISTDQAGSAHHFIEDGKNGFMVEVGNINALSKTMQFYIDHPEQMHVHGKRSLEIFQNFTPEKSADLFVSCIEEFLEPK